VNTASTPDCPSQDALRQLAAGLLANNVAHKLTNHAATCDHCGPLLRVYTEDFSEDFSPQEQAVLAKLQSSSAEWQRKTAQEMILAAAAVNAPVISANQAASFAKENATTAKENPSPGDNIGGPRKNPSPASEDAGITSQDAGITSQDAGVTSVTAGTATSLPKKSSSDPGWKPGFWKWALIPAATAACAAIAFGIWYTQRDTPEKVEKLLAQAYTEKRTMEMRIPYAAHADFKQKRSGESESILNLPPSLRKSAELIDLQLEKNPDNPTWLLLQARFELLEWNYKQALVALAKIEDTKVIDSPEMSMTRALALYEQAELESERRDQAYGEVVNLTGKIIQHTPDDPVALFNRALACEKIYAYECAIADYEHLLKIGPGNGWDQEIQDHLNRIREKKTLEH
jgi:hypothetical protein